MDCLPWLFQRVGSWTQLQKGSRALLVAPGDYAALSEAILRILGDGRQRWQTGAQQFASGFAWPVLGGKLWAALR